MPPLLEMRKITKRFPGVLADDQVDLTVQPGEIHALLGENGAGKSTLMQILYGLYQRDAGEILVDGQPVEIRSPHDAIAHGIGMIHQEFMLIPRFSVVENVVMGLADNPGPLLDLKAAKARLTDLAQRHGLAVDPNATVDHLPVGVQQRVEILKLLYRNARLLILDEPTAVLTPQEAEGLFKVLRSLTDKAHSVIFITHKLHEVMAVADRVTVLRDGKVIASLATSETTPRDLARMMVGREVAQRMEKTPVNRGRQVLTVTDLHVADDANSAKLNGISLEVHGGEILGVAGVDGNGQSELAEALLHLRPIARGQIQVDGMEVTHLSPAAHRAAGIAYIPADRRKVGSVGVLSIAQNAILGRAGHFARLGRLFFHRQRVNAHATALVDRYDVRTPGIHFAAGKLSGGNLQKVVLGREVMRQPRLLIVEQPTRGLDIGATHYVRQQLLAERARGAAILLISAELEEILGLSDRIAVLYQGRIMGMIDNHNPERGGNADLEAIGLMMAGTPLVEQRS